MTTREELIEVGTDTMGRSSSWRWWAPRHLTRLLDVWEPLIRADEREKKMAAADIVFLENVTLCQQVEILREALEFYADPATYHALAIWADPPCGDFVEDFSDDHGDDFYNREMPGKTARAALARLEEES
jgi:hypothetical protein